MSLHAVEPSSVVQRAEHPAGLSSFAGAGALMRLILRRDRIALPLWIGLPALLVVGIVSTFVNMYPTAEARQAFAAQVASSPAETALLGPVYAPALGGLVAWRWLFPAVVILGLANLFTVIRHTRTDEEAGRRELLGSTVIGRHAALAAALVVTAVADLVAALLVSVGLIGSGLPATGSLALGLGAASVGWTMAAVAAVAAQLTDGAGAAKGISGAVLGLLVLLRAIGDAGEGRGLGWLSWLSPVGWAGRIRPFAGERWWILGVFLGATALLLAAAAVLATRRDIGAGLLPARPGPAGAPPGLRSPLALAWRLQRGMLVGWTGMFAVYGALAGYVAVVVTDQLLANPAMMEFLARMGGGAQPSDVVFTLFFAAFGPVSAIYAIQAALRLRSEEEALRAELVLATSASRLRWMAGHLVVVGVGSAAVLAALGLAAGLTYAPPGAGLGAQLPRVLAAAMAYLPALWVLLGLTAALFGLLPRLVSVSWMVLVGCLLLELARELELVSQTVLDLSPFTHVPRLLLGQEAATPLVGSAAAALLLAAAGLLGFRHRDVSRV